MVSKGHVGGTRGQVLCLAQLTYYVFDHNNIPQTL